MSATLTKEPTQTTRFAGLPVGHYATFSALFVSLLLISNIGATKLIEFGPEWFVGGLQLSPIITDGGAFLFPLVYVLGDILSEVYGLKAARRTILVGFSMAILAAFTFWLVQISPPAADYANQDAFEAVLGFLPRIVLASLVAYLVGQLLNAWVLVKLKEKYGEGWLPVRLLGSTFVGQGADTLIFATIAFGGILTGGAFWNFVLIGWIYKFLVEVIVLPVTYFVIKWVKRVEPNYQHPHDGIGNDPETLPGALADHLRPPPPESGASGPR